MRSSLGVEIGVSLATAAAIVGIPVFASIITSQISDSIIDQSLITATLGVIVRLPIAIKFLENS